MLDHPAADRDSGNRVPMDDLPGSGRHSVDRHGAAHRFNRLKGKYAFAVPDPEGDEPITAPADSSDHRLLSFRIDTIKIEPVRTAGIANGQIPGAGRDFDRKIRRPFRLSVFRPVPAS